MAYHGGVAEGVSEKLVDEIYSFLKKALINFKEDTPFRGPERFLVGDFEYTFSFEGSFEFFKGGELIKHCGKEVFFQEIFGGVIE